MKYRKTQQYLYGRKKRKAKEATYYYAPGKNVVVRPEVIVRDLATGEVKRVIAARKYRAPVRVSKRLVEEEPKRVVSKQLFGSSGVVVAESTDTKFFGKRRKQ